MEVGDARIKYRIGSDGLWTPWPIGTLKTSNTFKTSGGQITSFRVRAGDLVGNVEPWPAGADTSTITFTWLLDGSRARPPPRCPSDSTMSG